MQAFSCIPVGLPDSVLIPVRRETLNANSAVAAEFQSISAAIDALRFSDIASRVLIVYVKDQQAVAEVKRLSGTLVGWPIIALVEAAESAEQLCRLNRAGAAQIVRLPLVSEDFQTALRVLSLQFGDRTRLGKVWAVTGAAAGLGTTTIAMNLAYEAAVAFKCPSLLIELDQRMGVLGTILDVAPQRTLADLVGAGDRIDLHMLQQILHPIAEGCQIVCSTHSVESKDWMTYEDLARVIGLAKQMAAVVVLDVPANFDDIQFQALANVDEIVMVGAQTVVATRSLRIVLEGLGPTQLSNSLHVVLNRYDDKVEGLSAEALQRLLGVPRIIPFPEDRNAATAAANKGKPLRLAVGRSPLLTAIDDLASSLLRDSGGVRRPERPSFLSKLRRAFQN